MGARGATLGIKLVMTAAVLLIAVAVPNVARAAQATGVCDWGGTAAAPTGHLTFTPGLTNTPSPTPVHFVATGPSQGGPCDSTVTFEGMLPAGETCEVQQFQQNVQGVPGVETASGVGAATLVQEILRNAGGQMVGFNDPSVTNQAFAQTLLSDPTVCQQAPGFTHADFFSIITVFGTASS